MSSLCLWLGITRVEELPLSLFADHNKWKQFIYGDSTVRPPTPCVAEEQRPPPGVKRITVVGDIMLANWMEALFVAKELIAAEPIYPFGSTAHILRVADIAAGNLESPMLYASRSPVYSINFAGRPARLDRLEAAGFDLVSLANNHILNRGRPGLEETIRHLSERSIQYAGAGVNYQSAYAPRIITLNDGTRVGWLGFSTMGRASKAGASVPVMAVGRPGMEAHLDAVREASAQVDFLVTFMHWGAEYTTEVYPQQRELARQLVDAGADLVVGSHPHRVQPFERYGDALIAYSLGNFAFGLNEISDKFARMTSGAILQCDLLNGRLRDFHFIPILEFQGEAVPISASCTVPQLVKAREDVLASLGDGLP